MAKIFAGCVLATVLTVAACGGGNGAAGPGDGGRGADGGGHGSVDGGGGDARSIFGLDGGGGSDAAASCAPTSLDEAGCQCTVGQKRGCYTGPPATRNVGACHDGTQTCAQSTEFGKFGPCAGSTTPGAETCSSTVDSNCNGLIGCADPVACPGGCHVDAGPGPDAGTMCVPPILSTAGERCPTGTVLGATGDCCPCTIDDCASNNACCTAPACAGSPSCSTCTGSALPAVCNGNVDVDCDDFDEDCDQLCCPCKPSSCQTCPTNQVPCDDGTGNLVCTDVTSNDNMCGACDLSCFSPEHCVNGWCQ